MYRSLPAFVVALVLSCSAGRAADCDDVHRARRESGPQVWAFLVGVNNYDRLADLPFCSGDVLGVQQHLIGAGVPAENIVVLHDKVQVVRGKPSRANFESRLNALLGDSQIDSLVQPGDSFLFLFSGHGVQLEGKTHLCFPNASDQNRDGMYPLQSLLEKLQDCPARSKLIVIDACRNVPEKEIPKGLAKRLQIELQAQADKGVVGLLACAPGEKSYLDDTTELSIFTGSLLAGLGGLADANDDGKVHVLELYNFLHDTVPARQPGQNPVITVPANFRPDDSIVFEVPGRNSIGMQFVALKPGNFEMGDGQRGFDNTQPHRVELTRPFEMGAHEVTVGQFRRFVQEASYKTESEREANGWGWDGRKLVRDRRFTWRNVGWNQTDFYPVVNVTYNDAVAFCRWLSEREGRTYRLPTEAEWEYACRAGVRSQFATGDSADSLQGFANVADRSQHVTRLPADWDDGAPFTSPVGRFKPNAWGLYDMHGNVWEWCADWYEADYYAVSPSEDPAGPVKGTARVLRGGSWKDRPASCSAAVRGHAGPSDRNVIYGFRVVRMQRQ